jgi:hypothetical protein
MSYFILDPSDLGPLMGQPISHKFFHIMDTLEFLVEDPLGKDYSTLWGPFKWTIGEKLIDIIREKL